MSPASEGGTMARLVNVRVSIHLWQEIMTEGWSIPNDGVTRLECLEGLPEGAELVSSGYDTNTNCVILTFHHESFENIPVGGMPSQLDPVFKEHYD
jgi:hypothetical protein